MVGICLLGLSAFTGRTEEKAMTRYDKTIGDTRVVLLAISLVNVLTATNSENDTTYLEITYLTEHIGTNSFSSPQDGSVTMYLQDNEHKESPLKPDAVASIFINGSICNDLPGVKVDVVDPKACHIRHVFLHGLNYASGASAACVIKDGFDGHLADFRFNDISLPRGSVNNEKMQ